MQGTGPSIKVLPAAAPEPRPARQDIEDMKSIGLLLQLGPLDGQELLHRVSSITQSYGVYQFRNGGGLVASVAGEASYVLPLVFWEFGLIIYR